MRKRRGRLIVVAGVLALLCPALFPEQGNPKRRNRIPTPDEVAAKTPSVKPKDGFVPDEITAVRIAEAVLIPIYGEKRIAGERPFRATLKDGVWTVIGTVPPNFMGGAAVVRLSKADGRILFVIHEA